MSLPATFDLTPEDAQLLLAANTHLGARNVQVCTHIPYEYISIDDNNLEKNMSPICSWFELRNLKIILEEFKNLPNLEELEAYFLMRTKRQDSTWIYLLECVRNYDLQRNGNISKKETHGM